MAMHDRGFTLLEILIALVIISIGLLGVAALQVSAQKAEMESFQRSRAMILLNDMANRISANRDAAGCYTTGNSFIGTGGEPKACNSFGIPSTQELALADLQAWDAALEGAEETLDNENASGLIGGRGCIKPNAANDVFVISVAWQGLIELDAPSDDCAAGQFGSEKLRRVVSTTVWLADLDS